MTLLCIIDLKSVYANNYYNNNLCYILNIIGVQISFAQDMYQMEENAEEIEVCAVASCPCPQKITVSLSLQSGTALPGVDYPEQSLDFTFNVNEDKVCTTVRILNDIIPEAREHFRINLMADSEYDILDPSYTTIIISDIDSEKYIHKLLDIVLHAYIIRHK